MHDRYLKSQNCLALFLKFTRFDYVSGIQRLTWNVNKGRGHKKEVDISSLNNFGTYSVEWAENARNSKDIVPVVEV